VALQPDNGLTAWWEQLGQDDPYALPPLSIASSEGIPAPGPITTPQYPAEIEMAPDNARPTLTPVVPEIEMPGTDVAAEREAEARAGLPPAPQDPYGAGLGNTIPGLSIPTDSLPPMPDPTAAHEQAVDSRIAGSEMLSDAQRQLTHEEAVANRVDATERLTEPTDAHETIFDAETSRRRGMSPEEVLRENADRTAQERLDDQDRQKSLFQKETEERQAAENMRRESRARAQQERAQLDAEAKALALKPEATDQDWYDEGGIGRRVGAFVVGLLGGLGKDYRGLDQINRSVDSFLAAKRQERQNQKGALSDRRQSLAEQVAEADQDWREAQVYRQATLERAKYEIETFQQNFDPESTRAVALDNARRQVDGELASNAAAAQAAREKEWEGRLRLSWEVEKNQRERDEARRKDMEAADKHAAAQKKLAGGGPGKPKDEDIVYTPEQWAARGVKDVTGPMSSKQLRSLQGLQKSSQEVAANQAGMSKEERENTVPGVLIKDASGKKKEFVAVGRPEDVSKLRDQVKAAKMIIGRMDDALRTRTGWSSDAGNSDERKKLAVQWGNAKVDAKGMLDLGAITAADVPLIEGVLGTSDPSTWKDPVAGITEARRIIENRVNASLEAAGYDIAENGRWQIAQPSTKRPERTADDAAFEKLQSSNVGSYTSFSADMQDDRLKKDRASESEVKAAYQSGGVPPDLRKTIDRWSDEARGGKEDPKAILARERLIKLVETGNDVVRGAAQAALDSALRPDVEQIGPSSAVVHDTGPDAPPKKKGGR
jgi:hypothetical protein